MKKLVAAFVFAFLSLGFAQHPMTNELFGIRFSLCFLLWVIDGNSTTPQAFTASLVQILGSGQRFLDSTLF